MNRDQLDPAYLGDIVEAGGSTFAREVADTFLTEASRRQQALHDALAGGDWAGAALAAHTIVSGSSMLGLRVVADTARQIESIAGHQRRPPDAQLKALDEAILTARAVLETAIADLADRSGVG